MLGKIVDKFRIDAVLGEGGMGIVYRAWDTVLERPVALKMVHRHSMQNDLSFRRFLAEAKILAKLDHPNIVPVYDLLEHEGSWFIVMQFVEGMTLAKIIEREGPMPYQRFAPICKEILSALSYAHRIGVIHRDIKPGNVIIAFEGTAKITDFGLAKSEHHPALTKSSSMAGTLYYMSPEQVKNLASVDHRSDLYATGMTMYEMLTGRTPFSPASPPVDIMNAILQQQFSPPSRWHASVPEALSQIVMKAIAKDPAKRFQSAEEMLHAMAQFESQVARMTTASLPAGDESDVFSGDLGRNVADDENREPPPKHEPPAPSPRARRYNRQVPGILGVAAAVLVIVLSFKLWQGSPDPPASATERPAPGSFARLSILSEPANAPVFLNDDSIGVTPIKTYSVKPGPLTLRIQKPGYLPVISTTMVDGEQDTTFFFPLVATGTTAPKTLPEATHSKMQSQSHHVVAPFEAGAIRIDSQPRGATIIFDGQARGSTPRMIKDVGIGEHSIVLRKTGYRDTSISVATSGATTKKINPVLLPAAGELKIAVRPSGAIFVDDELKRPDSSDLYQTILPAGSHRIRLESAALGFLEKTMDIEAGGVHDLTVDFTVALKLIVTAFDTAGQRVRAEVLVDGKRVGQTLQELDIRVGRHVIEVQREGYKLIGDAREIQLEDGDAQPVRLRFTLEKMQ
jgi:serine/threonine protein kinase